MANNNGNGTGNGNGLKAGNQLKVGDRVCVFPGLRKYSDRVKIEPGEVCVVVELSMDGPNADAVSIRLPEGYVVWVDADLVGLVWG